MNRDFYVTSMFGYHTQQPLVSMKLKDVAVQVTPEKAREMASMLLEAAEAAEQDGFIVNFGKEMMDLDEAQVIALMGHFREWKDAQRSEEPG